MKPVKRLKHVIDKNRVKTELDILIYHSKIVWYMIENSESDSAVEYTMDQSIEDFIKNGHPDFLPEISSDILNEISLAVKHK